MNEAADEDMREVAPIREAGRHVRISHNTFYRDLMGEAILVRLDTGEYFGLDDVAHRFWQLILENGDLDLVHSRLAREYEVDAKMLAADLDDLVRELARCQLIEIDPPRAR